MRPAQLMKHRRTEGGILGSERTASDKISRSVFEGIIYDALPKEADDGKSAVILVNAGAPKFDQRLADGFVRCKIEFASAIEAAIVSRGHVTGLHAVGSEHFSGGFVRDDEVFADAIELIFVQAGEKRFRESLMKFEIKDFKAQTQSGFDLSTRPGKPQTVAMVDGRCLMASWRRVTIVDPRDRRAQS
jgi:hypothetical protein